MTEQTRCLRCERAIDAYARICPYCNWDQNDAAVPPPQPSAAADYVPPPDKSWRKPIPLAAGVLLLLVGSFAIGAFVHGNDPPKNAPEPVTSKKEGPAATPSPRADITLVPVTDGGFDIPITSAPVSDPAEGVPNEYQRSDATAVSSVEYAQLAARATAEQKKTKALVDPRSITGRAYAQAPKPAPAPAPPPSQVSAGAGRAEDEVPQETGRSRILITTRPVAQYQPLPDITVSETTTARLELLIGADGRVKSVHLREGIPGQTAKLIATVQRWRFKPATENGRPVEAPFTVDISFRGRE
ncbi:MAG TPA: energy transducer TonB [Thermoanaerobaculia bacterium]|nr:energy transducer TonB [Thermoanaerobaculia bacterium]